MSGLTRISRARRGTGTSSKLVLAAGIATIAMQSSQTQATLLNLDLRNLTSVQIQQGYVAHTFTPSDIVETYLDQISKYNPVYDAYEQLNTGVVQDAAAETQQLQTPGFTLPSPIWGVPAAAKDAMNIAGMRTTAGSSYLGTTNLGIGTGSPAVGAIDLIPDKDSVQIARLRAAGALILGKTNVPDFYVSGNNTNSTLNGITRNAYDTSRTPGGSSGGSGVAVATGMTCIATAEETGSSITNPSTANSIVGIKPTFGTIPSVGTFPGQAYFRDTDGTFGKTVHDAAAMLDVEAGPSAEDHTPNPVNNNIPAGGFVHYINTHSNALQGARIGVLDLNGAGFSTTKVTNSEAVSLFNAQLAKLTAAGATLVTDPYVANNGSWTAAQASFPSSNTYSYDINQYLKTLGPNSIHSTAEYDATVAPISGKTFFQIPGNRAETIINGQDNQDDPATRADLTAYTSRVAQLRALFAQIMESQNLDALVLPQNAAPVGTLPNGGITRTPGSAPNIMGTPGVTVPGGYFSDGTPFEMYFIGELNDDAQVLALAADYEAISLNRIAPTLVNVAAPIPEPGIAGVACVGLVLSRRRRNCDRGRRL